jgi:hypothetical protein
MLIGRTFLTLVALGCFAAAYRFASHGIRSKDGLCIGLACAAVAVAFLLLWLAFRNKPRQRDPGS